MFACQCRDPQHALASELLQVHVRKNSSLETRVVLFPFLVRFTYVSRDPVCAVNCGTVLRPLRPLYTKAHSTAPRLNHHKRNDRIRSY